MSRRRRPPRTHKRHYTRRAIRHVFDLEDIYSDFYVVAIGDGEPSKSS